MIFTLSEIEGGPVIINVEPFEDERGLFARTVSGEEFEKHGLNCHFVQQSTSWNPKVGTLRGMHYQETPYEEEKLVRVTQGAVFDVVVDVRANSKTFGQWISVVLTAENRRQIFIPKGFAHGFQTLVASTEVFYEMTVPYPPGAGRGFLWSDPNVAIRWPETANRIIGKHDAVYSYLNVLTND